MKDKLSMLCPFPQKAGVIGRGCLTVGRYDTLASAANFGSPSCVFDEANLHIGCLEYRREFSKRHVESRVVRGSGAFINPSLAFPLKEEGLGVDLAPATSYI